SRRIGKINMYKLNSDFEAVLLLEKFALEVSKLNVNHKREEEQIHILNKGNENNIIDTNNKMRDFQQ
ncbi:MAG TPA: hypothetical protein VIP70_05860, partial [Nitrososphaeraceae archaeon]